MKFIKLALAIVGFQTVLLASDYNSPKDEQYQIQDNLTKCITHLIDQNQNLRDENEAIKENVYKLQDDLSYKQGTIDYLLDELESKNEKIQHMESNQGLVMAYLEQISYEKKTIWMQLLNSQDTLVASTLNTRKSLSLLQQLIYNKNQTISYKKKEQESKPKHTRANIKHKKKVKKITPNVRNGKDSDTTELS